MMVILSNQLLLGGALGILLGLVYTYYDLYNNKNIPTMIIYIGFAISLVFMLLFYIHSNNIIFHLVYLTLFMILGIYGSKTGAIGEADIWLMSSLWNFYPFVQLYNMNVPSIILTIGFASIGAIVVLFPIYLLKLIKYKPTFTYKSAALFFIYLILAFMIYPFANIYISGLFILLGLMSSVFAVYEKHINEITLELIDINRVSNGDVIDLNKYPNNKINGIPVDKVIDDEKIDRLKQSGVKKLWIYTKLPPFTPFLVLGFIIMVAGIYGGFL